ncbi:T9SS type A sorting domain-containing protein [Kaistella flava (ex Peng et al. 2021)]|uniref:T9SS type A sorting domain-containing protein n=1 Tax=Kaistella flava (ex Peng et al. 2021) TaxID=2038776 RepID=A0A7M2YAR2_9FLAO|nr:T9SS type A sorting domain-containing protein [Kaistella flava (ex Peng et al. 2021)]QOW10502.1 T9SS type A sorting domain-containing protein [Kaistella flava (ex Peng et al. 2021)]
MKKFYAIALGVCSIALANAQVSDLGSYVQVSDISNTGVAVGNVYGSAFFMWSEANSGTIIGEAGANGVSGNCNISADGSVISMAIPNPANQDKEEAVLYTVADQSLQFLGHLGFSSGADTSSAWGMSSDGKNIVGFAWNTSSKGEGVFWKDGAATTGLGSTVPTRSSRADAVSADGSVIVGWQDASNGVRQGAIWKNGVQELLKDNDGNVLGAASAVSADGKTVVGIKNETGEGYIWNETDGTIFLSSDDPYFITSMSGISDDGKVAIGLSFDPTTSILLGEGFIWTKEGGKVNLNDYVTAADFDDLDIVFSVPTGISPDGKYVGGIGANFIEGDAKGFLIKLPETALASGEIVKSAKMSVYPNPVKDILTITTLDKVESATVYSATGQVVFTAKNIVNKQINLSSLAKGVYFLQVQTDKGLQSVKLMKN